MTGEVRCPKCGRRTTIRTAREDDCKYYVCINYPYCRGRVPVGEVWGTDWGDDRGRGRPVTSPAYDRPRPRRAPSYPESGIGTVIRKPGKDKRDFDTVIKRPQRKSGVSIDEVWGNNWGDDWDKEILAPKPAPYLPQYPRAQKRALPPKTEEQPKPRPQIVPKKEATTEKKVPPKPRPQAVPKPAVAPEVKETPRPRKQVIVKKEAAFKGKTSYRPWWRRTPKKEAVAKEKKLSKPRPQIAPKPEAAPEKKTPHKPRPRIVPKEAIAPEKKAPPALLQQAAVTPEVAPAIKETPEPQKPVVPKVYAPDEVKESTRSRTRRVPQSELAPEKKKRSLVVIIIALIVAFIAIDGMIYAAVVLRNQGTPAPTPTTMSSPQDSTWLEYNL